jgi:hypothetical protein
MLPAGRDRRAPWACPESSPPDPQKPRLLDRVRQAIGTRHYSQPIEKVDVHWIKCYIFFHGMLGRVGGPALGGRTWTRIG